MAKNAPLNTAVLILASLLILAVGALAGERSIVSTDRVSPGDWTHDALMSLAADGLVPGMSARTFQGERRFTRLEMAGVVASVVRKAESESPNVRQSSLINHLVAEFGPELAEVAPDVASQWSGLSADLALPVDGKAFLLGYVRDLAVDQDPASPSPSDGTYRLSGFLNISDSMFAICTVAEHEDKVFHVLRTTNKYDKAFVRGQSGDVSWLVGRSYQNWSPAYTGSLILSDNGPALWQVRAGADLDFGKLIGEVKVTQFAGMFRDTGQRLYLIGRRYEKPLSNRWHLGVSETAKLNKMPSPLMAVMPFYLYQHLFLDNDQRINCLVAADLSYRMPSGAMVYGELVVDDITAPRIIGDSYTRPRKAGVTLGVSVPNVLPGDRYSSFTAEFTQIDKLTYSATRDDVPELAYIHDTLVIGSPIGPNSRAVYLRGEYSVSDRINLIGEYLNQRQKDPGPPERGSRRYLSLMASYDISPSQSLALRIAPYRIVRPDASVSDGTALELRASLAF